MTAVEDEAPVCECAAAEPMDAASETSVIVGMAIVLGAGVTGADETAKSRSGNKSFAKLCRRPPNEPSAGESDFGALVPVFEVCDICDTRLSGLSGRA